MPDIRLRSISKRFGDTTVIPGLDLTMPHGKVTVLLGPSGCGKSTLLRMIAGLETPTGGEICVGHQVINHLPPSDRGCALVFQNYALYPHKTVRQNLAFPLRMAKVADAEQAERVQQIADKLELTALLERYPRQLSGGQRQRVAMGRAMIRRPDVYLYDEPLSNLDLELRVRLRLEIAQLQRQTGATAVYVTHDQTEAMTLADQIVVLRKGRVEQVGAPLDLYRRPANLFVAGFIGTPRINLFGVLHSETLNDGSTRLGLGGVTLVVPRTFNEPVKTVGFRPEHAKPAPAGSADIPLDLFDCQTQAVEHLGDRAFAYLRSHLGDVVVLTAEGCQEVAGTLRLHVAPGALHFFGADEQALP